MKLQILWLYPDVKDVFGDLGNLQVLKKRCERRNIECSITTCGIDEDINMSTFDLIYFGTNISGKDIYVIEDLRKKKDTINKALQKGVFFFLVCGGFQAFGKEYIYEDETIPALGIFDYVSDYRMNANCIGNVYVTSPVVKEEIIGFENHHYRIHHVSTPLGSIVMGKGNDMTSAQEGFISDRVLATNLHGPLLPKNPQLADYILTQALFLEDNSLEPLDDTYEQCAREALLKRF